MQTGGDKLAQTKPPDLSASPELPPGVPQSSQHDLGKSIWDHFTDHPKTAAVLALLALASAYSPKASTRAAWTCLVLVWILIIACTSCAPQVKRSAHPTRYRVLAGIVAAIILGAYGAWLTDQKTGSPPIQNVAEQIDEQYKNDFTKEFTLGYKLFGIGAGGFYPFQGTADVGFMVNWQNHNYSWTSDDASITVHLPDITLQPNILLYDVTVVLQNVIGESVTFLLDPKSFRRGAAIVSNKFERSPNGIGTDASVFVGSVIEGFPGNDRIRYLTGAKVIWGNDARYQMGAVSTMGDILSVSQGLLYTSDATVFADVFLLRGNEFIGGPRGGYVFPRATTILGNTFRESTFDASHLPDGVIVSGNHFISARGVYRIGVAPELSFIVKIVKTAKNGNVLLFGAKTYRDDGDSIL